MSNVTEASVVVRGQRPPTVIAARGVVPAVGSYALRHRPRRRLLSVRAVDLMSCPAEITVDPRTHAGQQQVSMQMRAEPCRSPGPWHYHDNDGTDPLPPWHPWPVLPNRWTMREAASGRVRHLVPADTLPTVATTMCEAGTDTLPVLDDVGTVIGLVTIRDILELLATYAPQHIC